MTQRGRSRDAEDLDGLRLFALGRIPRCTRCPRYDALRAAHTASPVLHVALPRVPEFCSHQVCAPLADRIRRPRRAWTPARDKAFGA